MLAESETQPTTGKGYLWSHQSQKQLWTNLCHASKKRVPCIGVTISLEAYVKDAWLTYNNIVLADVGTDESIVIMPTCVWHHLPFQQVWHGDRCMYVCECVSICVFVCMYSSLSLTYNSAHLYNVKVVLCCRLRVCIMWYPNPRNPGSKTPLNLGVLKVTQLKLKYLSYSNSFTNWQILLQDTQGLHPYGQDLNSTFWHCIICVKHFEFIFNKKL